MADKGRVVTGARCRFSLKGVKVGYARSVTYSEEIQYDPIECLDNIEVEEHAPISYRVSLSAGLFRLLGETMKKAGWFPATGANSEEHLRNILTSGLLSAAVECRNSDGNGYTIIASLEQVKMASQNISIDARGAVGYDVSFVAIRAKDESEIGA